MDWYFYLTPQTEFDYNENGVEYLSRKKGMTDIKLCEPPITHSKEEGLYCSHLWLIMAASVNVERPAGVNRFSSPKSALHTTKYR